MAHYFEEITIYHDKIPRADVGIHFLKQILLALFGVDYVKDTATIGEQMQKTGLPFAKVDITDAETKKWEKAGYPPLRTWLAKERKKKR